VKKFKKKTTISDGYAGYDATHKPRKEVPKKKKWEGWVSKRK
jgi:hypothetical protein